MRPMSENISPIGQRISRPINVSIRLAEDYVQNDAAAQKDDSQGCGTEIPGLLIILKFWGERVDQSLEFLIRLGPARSQRNAQGQRKAHQESETREPEILSHFTRKSVENAQISSFDARRISDRDRQRVEQSGA